MELIEMDTIGRIKWKIYYEDQTTYCGDPWLAPALGVMCVVHADSECGRYMRVNHDYYWYDEKHNIWEGGDLFGLYDYLIQPGYRKVIFGRITNNKTFRKIYEAALYDPDFVPKTSNAFGERLPK